MRKFVVSDLHGDINSYNAIMGYLENVSKEDEVILYINGDLIDKGIYSADMLLDVKKRVEGDSSFKVVYLGGDHEWLMTDAYHILNKDYIYYNDRNCYVSKIRQTKREIIGSTYWGDRGEFTYDCIEDCFYKNVEETDEYVFDEDSFNDVFRFVKNLRLYQKLPDVLNGKQIVIAHASCPKNPLDICDLTIDSVCEDVMIAIEKKAYKSSEKTITEKEQEYYDILAASRINRVTRKLDPNINLGNPNYFTIAGHTSSQSFFGYDYSKKDNLLNIDGGNAAYWLGDFTYDHVPLVEIDSNNDRLIIIGFNHNNEIIYGTYFTNGISTMMNDFELSQYKKYHDKDAKIIEYEKDWFY